jgi:membrane-associated phospholipid phosphatase
MNRRFFSEVRLGLRHRIGLGATMLLVSLCYLPLNRLMSGGTTVEIWLDSYVPFWAIWIVPYLLTLVCWVAAGIWAFWVMDDPLYLAFVSSWVLACLIGFAVFLFYPTYMVRPELIGAGWADDIVRYVYTNDRTYNAFPSMHVWATVTFTLYLSQWHPKWRALFLAVTIVVALSTVFSGQHWIMDVVGGTVLAVVSYYLGPRVVTWLLRSISWTSSAAAGD